MKEWNHLTEATSLAKLAFQNENKITTQHLAFSTEYPSLKMPDNNPFKKRAVCEVQPSPEIQISNEQYSEVTEVEDDNVKCLTLESQESVASKAISNSGCCNHDTEDLDCKATESCLATQRTRRANNLKKTSSKTGSDTRKNSSILNFFSRIW